jgi:tripeptide aminopeptidase
MDSDLCISCFLGSINDVVHMFNGYQYSVEERFLRYVQIDTQSDPHSDAFPSTAKQLDLSRLLVSELLALGCADAELDEHGYVCASIPSNTDRNVPVVCFCAHVDTSPDCSGQGVKPIVHRNYTGEPIVLPEDPSQILLVEEHPYLYDRIGDDIVTASGTTLLGADDKAGVAVIMDMVQYLMTHPEVKHGKIRILFTPDEEIGRGVDKLDLVRLGADVAYTLDGSERGSLEDETFSADGVQFRFFGVAAHPGYAKDKLVNALKVAADFVNSLPNALAPETTEGVEGFVHPVRISGTAELAVVDFILRDFETSKLANYAQLLRELAEQSVRNFTGSRMELSITEQYRNMKEILTQHPKIVSFAEEAIVRAGLTVRKYPVRGGTDGSRLSFMGLPCPNLFTGEMAFHSKLEYVSIQDMQKAVETIVHLSAIWAEKGGEL